MSGRFNIVSRNGLLRADSEDGERLMLRIYLPGAKDVSDWETCVHVNLSDLRQIVSHFDWLQEGETSAIDALYEQRKREFARQFADNMLDMIRLQRRVLGEDTD